MKTIDLSKDAIDLALFMKNKSRWPGNITFSIPGAGASWDSTAYLAGSEPKDPDYAPLSSAQAANFRKVMALWDSYIAPSITEVSDSTPGQIRAAVTNIQRVAQKSADTYAYAYDPPTPDPIPTDPPTPGAPPPTYPEAPKNGDVWIGSNHAAEPLDSGSFGFQALLHEVGHGLGLKHPFDSPTSSAFQSGGYDTYKYSLMSYTPTDFFYNNTYKVYTPKPGQIGIMPPPGGILPQIYDSTPSIVDIKAMQDIYGADPTTNTRNDTYKYADSDLNSRQVIYDAGGTDTIDVSGLSRGSRIDLTPGSYSDLDYYSVDQQVADVIANVTAQFPQGTPQSTIDFYTKQIDPQVRAKLTGSSPGYQWTENLGIAFGTTIENVIGGAKSDVIKGNTADNVITGGGGGDVMTGGGGNDIFKDTGANLKGATITDFTTADLIDVTDASGPLSDLTYSGSTLSFSYGGNSYTMTLQGGTVSGDPNQKADANGGVDIYFGSGPSASNAPTISLPGNSNPPSPTDGTPQSDLAPGGSPAASSFEVRAAADAAPPQSDISNNTTTTVTGTASAGNTVTIFNDENGNGIKDAGEATVATAAVAPGATTYSVTFTLPEGDYTLTAFQTDASGVVSASSAPIDLTIDTSAPTFSSFTTEILSGPPTDDDPPAPPPSGSDTMTGGGSGGDDGGSGDGGGGSDGGGAGAGSGSVTGAMADVLSGNADADAAPSVAAPGQTLVVTLNASEGVTVTGTPTVTLSNGAVAKYDADASTPVSLLFTYTLSANDTDPAAIKPLSLNLPNGAAISDFAGNSAAASLVNIGRSSTATPASVVISGTQANQKTLEVDPIKPFASASLSDPNDQATDTLTITPSGGKGTLSDAMGFSGLTANSDGSYTLKRNTAANLTTELQGLTFTPASIDSTSFGLALESSAGISAMDITTSVNSVSPLAFDPTVTFSGPNAAILTGTAYDPSGIKSIELYEGSKDLGAATIKGDGTWNFVFNDGRGPHNDIHATAVANDGSIYTDQSDYDLVTGIRGEPFTAVQTRFDPATGHISGKTLFDVHGDIYLTVTDTYGANGLVKRQAGGTFFDQRPYSAIEDHFATDGSHTERDTFYKDGHTLVEGLVQGVRLDSNSNDVFRTVGSGNTFAFTPGFGHDVITQFVLGGANHDTISLPAGFASQIDTILAGATGDGRGNTTIQLGGGDSITLDGVAPGRLRSHPDVFTFSG